MMELTGLPLSFFVIGAARSGTTSLHHYLAQHPQVFLPPMKPRYLALAGEAVTWNGPGDADLLRNAITRPEDYRALFAGVRDEAAVGEVSTLYLYTPFVAPRIREAFPGARIIALLRNPAERAFSAFMTMRRRALEPLADFAEALDAEPERIARSWSFAWHYRRMGFYYEQLARYYALFPRSHLRVYLFDDFSTDPLPVLADCFRFLGVDTGFHPDVSTIHNPSGLPRSRAVEYLVARPNPLRAMARVLLPLRLRRRLGQAPLAARLHARNTVRTVMPADIRRALLAGYHDDLLRLQDLIDRDLGHWLP